MTSWRSSIKIWFFFKLIECIIKKGCHGVKQNAKRCAIGEQNVVLILGGQRIDQKRKKDGGEGEERGLRKGAERG